MVISHHAFNLSENDVFIVMVLVAFGAVLFSLLYPKKKTNIVIFWSSILKSLISLPEIASVALSLV